MPLIFNTQSDRLTTDRTGDGLTSEGNDLRVSKAVLSFSPQYEYSLRDFVLRAEVPVRGDASGTVSQLAAPRAFHRQD